MSTGEQLAQAIRECGLEYALEVFASLLAELEPDHRSARASLEAAVASLERAAHVVGDNCLELPLTPPERPTVTVYAVSLPEDMNKC